MTGGSGYKDKFAELSNYIDLLIDAICVVNEEGRFQFVSAGGERIFGYTPDEMIGRQMLELMHPDDRQRTMETVARIMGGEHKVDFENRYVRKDGSVVDILWSARWSETEQIRVAVARDITRRKRAESMQAALLATSEAAHVAADLADLYRRLAQIIIDLIPARGFALAEVTEGRAQLVYQQPGLSRGDELKELATQVVAQQRGRLSPSRTSAVNLLAAPLPVDYGLNAALLLQSDKAVGFSQADLDLLTRLSEHVAAAIERKQLQTRLQEMASFDQLTQLANRHLLQDRVQRALTRAERGGGMLALLYIDLDDFKQINDALGHAAGDEILKQAAGRLLTAVRRVDTVARVGGDEFVVLLEDAGSKAAIKAIAEKIRITLNEPFTLHGKSLTTPPSIGIAVFPGDGDTDQQLLISADNAMYLAKNAGGNRVSFCPQHRSD